MQYKIIVDKQSRTNPSNEKKEYIIEIEELRRKGDIADTLVITKDEDYVMRRLSLSEYHVLKVLDEPIKQPLQDINIELFEGDNYIYLLDMTGNRFYAEYLIKNDFNDTYITKSEAQTAINQSAHQIELTVDEKLTGYDTSEQVNAKILAKAGEINLEVAKKANSSEVTSAQIMLKINNDQSEVKINADKVGITATKVIDILAGNEINMTAKNITFKSTKFNVDKNGKVTCSDITATGGTIGGFTLGATQFSSTINGKYNYNLYDVRTVTAMCLEYIGSNNIYDVDGNGTVNVLDANSIVKIANGTQTNNKTITGTFQINSNDPKNFISIKNGNILTVSIGAGGINSNLISAENIICGTQTTTGVFNGVAINGNTGAVFAKSYNNSSLESIKKNITKFENAIEIIENSEIYEYNFKDEEDAEKKHIGFVIGEKYNTPDRVIAKGETSIESYSMQSIMWRGMQEILKRLKVLEAK